MSGLVLLTEQCAPVNRRHWATRDGRSEVPEGDHAHCERQVGDGDVLHEGGGEDGVALLGAQLVEGVGGNLPHVLLALVAQPLVGPCLPLASLGGQVHLSGVLSRTLTLRVRVGSANLVYCSFLELGVDISMGVILSRGGNLL